MCYAAMRLAIGALFILAGLVGLPARSIEGGAESFRNSFRRCRRGRSGSECNRNTRSAGRRRGPLDPHEPAGRLHDAERGEREKVSPSLPRLRQHLRPPADEKGRSHDHGQGRRNPAVDQQQPLQRACWKPSTATARPPSGSHGLNSAAAICSAVTIFCSDEASAALTEVAAIAATGERGQRWRACEQA